MIDTSVFLVGLKMQWGLTSSCCTDQKEPVKVLYAGVFSARTLSEPNTDLNVAHWWLSAYFYCITERWKIVAQVADNSYAPQPNRRFLSTVLLKIPMN